MSEQNTEYHVDTDDVLKELQAEGFEVEGKEPSQQEEVQEPVVETEEPTGTEVETEVEVEEPVNRQPKEPALIPAWKARIAQDKLAKENEALKQQIEAFQNNPTKENRQEVSESVSDIRELARQHGLEIDENQEQFFRAIMGKKSVPDEVLKDIQAFQHQKQVDYLEQQYETEFSKDVVPLLKEHYGELSDKELTTLRNKLHDVAFTEEYAKVPLKKIFKAEADDLNFKPSKHPIVTSKSGKLRNTEIDLSNVDESEFASLNDEQLETFIQQKSGNNGWSRR